MKRFPIGIIVDSFKIDIPSAVRKAAECGAQGIQVYASHGDYTPQALSPAARAEFRNLVKDNGLVISALCGDLGGGFGDPAANVEKVEQSKRIIDLALDLGTDIVTTHIGVVPTDPHHERYGILQEACGELAAYADSCGAHFAVETGPETAETLCGFLDTLGSTGVGVNLDPANLVMVTGDDPVRAVHTLKKYIVHTHAKDGRRLRENDPEVVYGVKKDVIVTDRGFIELPLGEGDVPFPAYLAALEEIGFDGFLTIEREVGDNPERDIRAAVEFLKQTMAVGE
ncbi:MAG: sugar phosphate isomerase/epimerase [Clostridia bacterium]|nr:sugar phosphate isomerase/epimerase [Clostridia bacterium]